MVHIDGEPLSLSGSSDKYDVKVSGGSYAGSCAALCDGNPCGDGNTCEVDGEAVSCLLVARASGLETGNIVVILFVAIVVVFVLFHTPLDLFQRCVKTKKDTEGIMGAASSSSVMNGKPAVNMDNVIPAPGDTSGVSLGSRYGLSPNEEEMIIRNHIVENLAGQKTPGLTVRPDLIGSSYSPQSVQLADGTVIMEPGDIGVGGEEDAPEHYDFENASSIAPSDIAPSDMIRHYRDFRNGTHHQHHYNPAHNNQLFNKYRDSPASVGPPTYRSSPAGGPLMNHHVRQSPVYLQSNHSAPNHSLPNVMVNSDYFLDVDAVESPQSLTQTS